MSGLHETIAQLTGNLNFLVDTSGLLRFENSLNQISKRMTALSAQADKLAAKLGGVSPKSSTQKLDASVEQSKGRALKLETELAKAQRATFQAELQQNKLKFSGLKEEAFLSTQSLKQKQLQAVLEAKSAKVEQEHLKSQGIQLKNQQGVEAAKLRQSRLESLLRQQQQKTLMLQEKQLQQVTATQRAELTLQQARERGQRATERYQQRMADRKARELKLEETSARQAAKFKWAESRQAVWAARQDAPAPAVAESGGLGMVGALSGIAMAVYAISTAATMLSERVEHRQESTSDTQQFSYALMAVSEDPEKRKKLNAAYIRDSKEYGMAVDKSTAREYSNSAAGLMNHGYSDDQAATTLHNRMAVFRAANLDPVSAARVNYQMSHVVAKGYASGIDYKALTNNLGAKLAGDIDIGSARFLGFKGKDEDAKAFMLKQQKERKITPKALDAGFAYTAVKNKDIVERHAGSIEAAAQNLATDKYLQLQQQQQDPELVKAIGERITAERELVVAMAPVNNTLKNFDIALTQFQTGLFRTLAGKDFDGTVKDSTQRAADVASVGTVEGPAIDPSALTGKTVGSDRDNIHDPVDAFWKWLFNADQDKDKVGPANSLKVQAPDPFSPVPTLDTSGFGAKPLPVRLEDLMQTPMLKGLVSMAVTDADRNPAATGVMSSSDAFYKASQQSSVTNNNNTTNNITNAPVTSVTVNANTNADAHEIAEHARNAVHSELKDVFSISNTAIGTKAQ